MQITLRTDKVYGRDVIYPACAKSKLLAQLRQTKTFSRDDVRIIESLGFKIQYHATMPDWLKDHVPAMV
jgi:hypothetical protein